jgi:hypothetical protein
MLQPNHFKTLVLCRSLPVREINKQDAESPMPFLEIMNRSLVTWIDYITDDPLKDLPLVAAQLGFSEPFTASISTETTLNYQDFDTEMWLRLPCIQIRGVNVTAYPLLMLVRKNVVFTIHRQSSRQTLHPAP